MKKHTANPHHPIKERRKWLAWKTRQARQVLLSVSVVEAVRPAWAAAVAAGQIVESDLAFFGGTRRKLDTLLANAGLPESSVEDMKRAGLLMFYPHSSGAKGSYLLVDKVSGFPFSFPDEITVIYRDEGKALIKKHLSELPAIDAFIAQYALACSFAIPGGQLRCSLFWVKFLLNKQPVDYTECEAVLISWEADGVIKRLTDERYYIMFDVNLLVGDWGQA